MRNHISGKPEAPLPDFSFCSLLLRHFVPRCYAVLIANRACLNHLRNSTCLRGGNAADGTALQTERFFQSACIQQFLVIENITHPSVGHEFAFP